MRFRPDRPIYLNCENTKKTSAEVIHLVMQLRDLRWLCVVGDGEPIHLSFDNLSELAKFRKDAESLGVSFASELVVAEDDFADIVVPVAIPEPKPTKKTKITK